MKKILIALISFAILALNGCLDEKNEYYVNPDGSGKVVREVFSTDAGQLDLSGSNQTPDPEMQLKELVQGNIQNCVGIETWSDIQADITDDGKLHFKGTAYFKDISQVSFDQEGLESDNGFIITLNNRLLTLDMKAEQEESAQAETDYTDQQIKNEIKKQRLQFNQSRPLIEGILRDLKQTYIVHYKGRIKKAVNFQQGKEFVSLTIDGEKMLEYMNDVMGDDKKLEAMIRAGKNMQDGSGMEDYFQYIGGQPVPPHAEIQLTAPLFDYDKEVAKAKAAYPEMIKSLNLTSSATVETETIEYQPGMDVQNLRVGGVRIVYFEDKAIDYRPFYQSKGYQLSVTGQMPARDLQIAEAQVTKAQTLQGENLLPESDFQRKLSSLEIADDGISVSFEIQLNLPENDFSGLSEVAGSIQCFAAQGTKTIDLGLMDIKEGAANEAEGVSISQINEMNWGDEKYEIDFKLKILKHLLKKLHIYKPDGTEIETSSGSSMSSNNFLMSYGVRIKGDLPEKARVTIELYDNLKEYQIPFSLKNISLAGKPLAN